MKSDVEQFEAQRDRLEALGYQMTGRLSVAQDLVQEAYLRWQEVDHASVDRPEAYLTTIMTRLCLDQQKSAQNQREAYPGPWLPEPQVEDVLDPEQQLERDDSISMALLVLLETLSPMQRAAFVLREAFAYDYASIAEVIDRSEAHCRKIVQRARERIADGKPRYESSREVRERLLAQFLEAVEHGDPDALGSMLADDATLYSDGGGEVPYAATRPIYGSDRITRFMIGIRSKAPGLTVRQTHVGGGPGFVAFEGQRPQSAWAFQVVEGKIQTIYAVVNPDKLRHVGAAEG